MLFFDSHVHIYPEFDPDTLFESFWANSMRLAKDGDCRVMAVMLREFQTSLAAVLAPFSPLKWKISQGPDVSFIAESDGRKIILLPARQIAAREKIEALGLFGDAPVPDGLPLAETFSRLSASGYTPVLAWGLGKWLFKRAAFVDGAISRASSSRDLMICDSALRPSFWGTPRPMRAAARKGLRVIYGSDPLPRKGDEVNAGRYAMLVDAEIDPASPAKSLLAALLAPETKVAAVGRRHSVMEMVKHL